MPILMSCLAKYGSVSLKKQGKPSLTGFDTAKLFLDCKSYRHLVDKRIDEAMKAFSKPMNFLAISSSISKTYITSTTRLRFYQSLRHI